MESATDLRLPVTVSIAQTGCAAAQSHCLTLAAPQFAPLRPSQGPRGPGCLWWFQPSIFPSHQRLSGWTQSSHSDPKCVSSLNYLVGGIPTPLKNMSSSVRTIIPNIWKITNVPNQQPAMIYCPLNFRIPELHWGTRLDELLIFGAVHTKHSPVSSFFP